MNKERQRKIEARKRRMASLHSVPVESVQTSMVTKTEVKVGRKPDTDEMKVKKYASKKNISFEEAAFLLGIDSNRFKTEENIMNSVGAEATTEGEE